MRFRRRVKICKGIYVNFSGSGVSVSAGVKGASVTLSKKGVYANYGIPGTGLYQREQIVKRSNNSRSETSNRLVRGKTTQTIPVGLSTYLDANNNPIVCYENGTEISDETLLRAIRRTPEYKLNVQKLYDNLKTKIEDSNSSFIEIYKQTETLIDKKNIEDQFKNLKLETYQKQVFDKTPPAEADIRDMLQKEAEQKIKSIFFWNNKKNREEFVCNYFDERMQKAYQKWEQEKKLFEYDEEQNAIEQNEKYRQDYEEKRETFENYLYGDSTYIESKIAEIVSLMSLPVEFSLDYEFDTDASTLHLDLDLPEIEDMPTDTTKTLKSGKVSVKDKTKTQLNTDYATCVCGLAFFFAGMFFNVSGKIQNIKVSGYTQRYNKKADSIVDEYVYSVVFNRELFSVVDRESMNPLSDIQCFPHLINVTATNMLKTIDPNAPLQNSAKSQYN